MRALSFLKWMAGGLAGLFFAAAGVSALDEALPPPLEAPAYSAQVLDRHGALLFAQATEEGRWRFPVSLDGVDDDFLAMLVAFEDKRFFSHAGVDPLAIVRAGWQLAMQGRIVSGGSTITMQLARLLEPRAERSMTAKLRQMLRAIQIERRLSKREILERYLTIAPYGGNLEGIRAATLAWFGKEPGKLRLSEAALLVALPQSPEVRRPDRAADAARAARDRVLWRMAEAGLVPETEIARASSFDVPHRRRAMPSLSPHLAMRLLAVHDAKEASVRLTLDGLRQGALETVAREGAERLPPGVSVAMVLLDAATGDMLARVGSAGYLDERRSGWVDMADVPRSPGSALKPFIYGLAFEQGLVAPETIISDRPADFGGYRPANFDMGYKGDVSVREALQWSLNVPAVRLLDAVGPQRLASRLRRAGASLVLPQAGAPGLAIGLGGAGVTLTGLAEAYTALANTGEGTRARLHHGPPERPRRIRVLEPAAAWQVGEILSGVSPPAGAAQTGIAYKTGTSYGYRDAWAVGFDGRHVLAVWTGRPDNAAVPGMSGAKAAAPILFDGWVRAGLGHAPLPARPRGAVELAHGDLPQALKRFTHRAPSETREAPEPAPVIVYPPAGARVELAGSDAMQPLILKLQGGRAPFRWLANGAPLDGASRRRMRQWQPDGKGHQRLTVIDAAGRAASVDLFVQ
ncbi:MAG: penicillin-binding protein 1C [Zhengella sp.]|uniref:penicillin-binding protein 1C n=1 Tax=Zhengella sp. TaxID=2282762 RepID=UPI0035273E55